MVTNSVQLPNFTEELRSRQKPPGSVGIGGEPALVANSAATKVAAQYMEALRAGEEQPGLPGFHGLSWGFTPGGAGLRGNPAFEIKTAWRSSLSGHSRRSRRKTYGGTGIG